MSRRYMTVLGAVLVAAVAITLLGRMPRRAPAAVTEEAPIPTVTLALAIEGSAVVPARVSVPKDHDVLLSVENRGARAVAFELAGYDGVEARIEAGATWTAHFRSDRPGDDFAWLVDGAPAGRLLVAGSHLVEGHR